MFLISLPYRLALSHCHGLFFVIWLGNFPFFFFDCPPEEGAHSCLGTSWEKSETKSSVKKEVFVFCPVSIVFCRGIRISLIMFFNSHGLDSCHWNTSNRARKIFLVILTVVVCTQNNFNQLPNLPQPYLHSTSTSTFINKPKRVYYIGISA